MDTRIGYPNEHLAPGVPEEMASPMYSTGIGLVIIGLQRYERDLVKNGERNEKEEKAEKPEKVKKEKKTSKSFLDKIKKFFEEDGV
jgi:cell division protein FtsA